MFVEITSILMLVLNEIERTLRYIACVEQQRVRGLGTQLFHERGAARDATLRNVGHDERLQCPWVSVGVQHRELVATCLRVDWRVSYPAR